MNHSPDEVRGEVHRLTAHLFRHQAGRITTSLTRILGWDAVDTAEDIVQEALAAALEIWPYKGIPDEPAAWLWQVARNRATDRLRRKKLTDRKLADFTRELESRVQAPSTGASGPDEDLLATMFACAHPALPRESQVALMLRILCGFTTGEIAKAYLEPEATVLQRIVRAKKKLRNLGVSVDLPSGQGLAEGTEAVHLALYLMFNEGYSAHSGAKLLRDDFCAEALRLASTLCAHDSTDSPAARALLALMCFQSSRMATRTDADGNLLLLSEQDRTKWDRIFIASGFAELERAAWGMDVSTYHLEAGIAACHVAASRYEDTEWPKILALYDQLVEMSSSPVFALNRAVAVGMVHGHLAALEQVERLAGDPRFERYHLYYSTLAEFNSRAGRRAEARRNFEFALTLAGTEPERRFLQRRLSDISG